MDVSDIYWGDEFYVLEGADAVYDVSSVGSIDANLANIGAHHPDADRLLDARRLVALANGITRERA